ncbi:MAG TPA: DUF4157 domain-containing protein [Candidatus Flavonifractor avistercoris]|nr:DUF4157 domain-containing protein [Candidatus Flavonifractor avistercoris]
MSQVYTTRRRAAPNGAEPAAPSSKAQQPEVNQSSLSLDGGGMGSRLDELMQEKMRQHFLDSQIPEAEREADRLASAAQGARTPEEVKARMGQRLGADFSGVRFHADSGALRTAEDMGARAYATGRDIYFGQGGFDPAVAAHELVHTVQQGQVESSAPTVSAPAGQVQMLPKRLKAFGHSVAQAAKTVGGGIARVAKAAGNGIAQGARTVGSGLAHALKIVGHSFAKVGTGIGEFVGGKAGLLKPSEEQRDQALAKAQQGDYSQFAILRKADAQAMVDAKKAEFLANGMPDPKQLSTTEMLNPVTRKAMSQIAGDEKLQIPDTQRRQFREAGEVMDQRMIVNTMKKVSDGQAQRMVQHYQNMDDQKRLAQEYARSKHGKTYLGGEGDGTLLGAVAAREQALANVEQQNTRSLQDAQALAQSDIDRAQNSGDAMLRLMFMMQLGNFQRTDGSKKAKTSRAWDQTMANAFSHGGRTGFVFAGKDTEEAGGTGTDAVFDAVFGGQGGAGAGVHVRAAGTHHMNTPKAGKGMAGYKEKGGIGAALGSKADPDYQHFGMDMGIGGVGNLGTAGAGGQGQMINADGRSGHMYIGRRMGTASRKGGLLVGLESDSPYRMNQTGHMHNAAAQAEEGSSTGGLKTDIQGNKYGGRTVDLSGLTNQEMVATLHAFTSHFSRLRDEDEGAYNDLLERISGKRMDADSMNALLGQMLAGEENEALLAKLKHMRRNYPA